MLRKISLRRNDQVVHHTEEEEAEIVEVTEVVIVEVTEVDVAEAEIVADMAEVTVAAQAAVVTRKAMADRVTGQPIKVAEIAVQIQAVQQPVRIRTEEAAGLQAENPGIRNKPESRERKKDSKYRMPLA